ncbi:hypothetical protein [Peptostreptococcus canis]|nr:hypothetical protein [Peptostreptococcus canis]MBP1998333.1 tetratricopeptide (TPR) repeat protein [Peptostreptococcus canis]
MSTYNDYAYQRELFNSGNFRRLYESLNKFVEKDAEWYFLRGLSAMKLGFYEEGEDYIKRAKYMNPENQEYKEAYEQYINYRDGYNNRANFYNNSRHRMNNPGCCCCCSDCCCCGDDCCENLCKLWLCDSCCECMGGDLIECC